MTTTFTPFEQALVIVPKCTAFVSFWCSFFIVQHVLKSKERRSSTYHRILLGMSMMDMIGSFGYFLSSWPIPADAEPPIYGARGTTATCTAQGFFQHGGNLSAPLYNASLVTHNLLVITFGWSKHRVQKFEWVFHAFPLIIAWGVAIASLFLQLYNPAHWVCFIGEYPEGCQESFVHGGQANCIRGDNSTIYRFAFVYAEIWFTIIYVAIGMSIIYWSVLKTERDMDRYDFNGERRRTGSRRIAQRSLCYVLGFIVTWLFATIARIWEEVIEQVQLESVRINDLTPGQQVLWILVVFFLPLQGFFNVLVYVRPKYSEYLERNPEFSLVNLASARFLASTRTLFASSRGHDNKSGSNNSSSSRRIPVEENNATNNCEQKTTSLPTKSSMQNNKKQEEVTESTTEDHRQEIPVAIVPIINEHDSTTEKACKSTEGEEN